MLPKNSKESAGTSSTKNRAILITILGVAIVGLLMFSYWKELDNQQNKLHKLQHNEEQCKMSREFTVSNNLKKKFNLEMPKPYCLLQVEMAEFDSKLHYFSIFRTLWILKSCRSPSPILTTIMKLLVLMIFYKLVKMSKKIFQCYVGIFPQRFK